MIFRLAFSLFAALLVLGGCSRAPDDLVVFAPASLQGALDEVAEAWVDQMRDPPTISYASTSALARQIAGGAPADIFISADEQWMDELEAAGLLRSQSRADLLGNGLVLIQSSASRRRGEFRLDQASWEGEIAGKWLALAEPETVPAGRYAKAALQQLGLWEAAEGRVVPVENVRAALALVERGEADFGIVYATDAQASDKVVVIAQFPSGSHPSIRYPIAVLASSDHPDAVPFRNFLTGEQAQAIFARHGFRKP